MPKQQKTVISPTKELNVERSKAAITAAEQAAVRSRQWTGNLPLEQKLDKVLQHLCNSFNESPFFAFSQMKMVVDKNRHDIQCVLDMDQHLIGNVAFQILHGGVSATLLDSIGGIVAMAEIYKRASKEEATEMLRKITRLATVDMRVDYIAPGRGNQFIGTAEVLRMGRKGCTMRMHMHNDEGKLIATGIASYAY